MVPQLSISRTADAIGLPLPSYKSRYHMGLVLNAAIPTVLKLEANERALIPIGFCMGIPDRFCGQIVSLPEMVENQGIVVITAPQLLNPADRGPVQVYVQNISNKQQIIHRGDEFAALLITPAVQVAWNEVETNIKNTQEG